jgi:glycosyltransferase 2 family protein
MKRLSSFVFLLGLILFVILLRMVDLPATWQLLKSAQPFWVGMSFFFLLPEILFKGLRLTAMSRVFHSKLSVKQAVWIYLAGQPLSAVTPAKLGDIVRVLGIGRWGNLKPHSAFAVHVADKVYDLLTLGLMAATGLIVLISQNQHEGPAVSALLGIGLGVLLMALFLNPQWMERIIKPLLLFLAPKQLAERLRAHGREFYQSLLSLFQPSHRVALPFLLSLAAWTTVLTRAYFCALALGLPLSFTRIALLLPVVVVIEFIPVTILGFGTREASLFLFFASSQVDKSGLLSFSLMMVLAGPLGTALMGIPFAMKMTASKAGKP